MSRVLLSILLLLPSVLLAQTQDNSRIISVRGTVVNSDESPASNAVIELRSLQTGEIVGRAFTTNGGQFQVPNVAAGNYLISVADGTHSVEQQISVTPFQPDLRIAVPGNASVLKHGGGETVSVSTLRVPEKAKRALQSAQEALSKNNVVKAKKELERALSITPEYPEALSLRAVVHLASGDADMAIKDASQSTKLDPQNSLAYTVIGASYNALGKFVQAINPLRQALRINPSFWQSHFEMAKCLYGQGESASALKEIQMATESAPKDFAPIHLMHGAILMKLQRRLEAANEFQDYLRMDPNSPDAAKVQQALAQLSAPSGEPAPNGAR